MKVPDVDVILLSWNRAQMTIETIQSLQEQEGVNAYIWIVDQGSNPAELKLLKDSVQPYNNVYIKELPQNVGVPGGRNIGTRLGKAAYTVSIDNDAIFESKDALRRVVEKFEQQPKVGVISFRIKNFYSGEDDELSWVYPKGMKTMKDDSFTATRFVGCGHAIRRETFAKAQGYDDDLFFYWEEVDFSYRAINAGYQLIYDPEVVVLHKVSPEARVRWEEKRFYYLVRNAIYINLKYNQSFLKALVLAGGYMLKGVYNGLLGQTFRGIADGIQMSFNQQHKHLHPSLKLSKDARRYIWENEIQYRGSFWNRLKTEIFVGLPGRN